MSALDDVLAAFASLLRDYEATEIDPGPGEGNFRCVDCHACYGCRFCVSCDKCEECTYCEGCAECIRCTQSKDSRGCEDCTHIDHCRECVRCHYVTLSVGCEDCVQCFACVGLSGEEFCILNERHSRRSFLEKVAELRAELEQRRQHDKFRPAIDGPLAEDNSESPEQATNPILDVVDSGPASPSEPALPSGPRPGHVPSLTRGTRPGPRPGERAGVISSRPTSLVAGRRPERPPVAAPSGPGSESEVPSDKTGRWSRE